MPRKSKPQSVEPTIIEPVTPAPTAIVEAAPPARELVLEGDPEAQLEFASRAAKALMSIVSKKPKPVIIQGKQFLEYGDWQVLGRFYGATVEIEWTKELPNRNGYEARALVKRNGVIISSAEGMCTRDERRWAQADDYAVRSMAQTRTAAKALRNAFGWVAELAGYSGTPAEEMPRDIPSRNDEPFPSDRRAAQVHTDEESKPKSPKVIIAGYLARLGHPVAGKSKEEADGIVLSLTGLDMVEANYDEITSRLHERIVERDAMP